MRPIFFLLPLLVLLVACNSGNDITSIDSLAPVVLSSALIESGPLVRTLRVTLEKPVSIEVEYWTDGEPHRHATSAGTSDSVLLARLHANRTYHYAIVGTGWQGTFKTDPLPTDLAKIGFAATGSPTTPLVLLHLFQQNGFRGYAIVDSGGEVVWYWRTVDYPFGMARRDNGNFVFMDHGRGLVEVTPSGSVVHELAQDLVNREMHHDAIMTHDNTILFIAFDARKVDTATVKGEAIWEWSPELGIATKRWSSWDFLSVTGDRGPRFGTEWMHANSLAIGPRGNVLLGVHYFNQIISIQPDFKSIEWRLGGVNATIPVEPGEQFSGMHTAREIAPGRIIMFDNRLESGGHSRAAKFDISGGTAHKVWEWSSTPPNFAAAVGAARRLDDGNTLVAFGMSQGIAGSTGPTEVYEITPGGEVLWHLVVSNVMTMFRAEPIASIAGEK
jgi:hypothetical protein